ncbi:uncharacterized protein LOC123896546 [Trifolium pratense]|uniref:uncharacterized protein LOC123896546 n=1 Tax=Trifolium pratense TaxID=57577 RepID=UPI001E692607|nr:uncharacterized protein LOC123896546 [Trifolium pratense]
MDFTNRNWMYDRHNPGKRGRVKEEFKIGVEMFINTVKYNDIVIREGGIRCPCVLCRCTRIRSEDEIRSHLYKKGFQPNYWVWSSHGEGCSTTVPVNQNRASSSVFQPVVVPEYYHQHYDPFNEMDNMITNALGFNTPIYVPNDVDDPADDEYDADVNVERPNEEAQRFFDLLKETNTPLCEGSRDSKLTVCIRLLGIKSECLVSEYTMDLITKLMLDITIDRPLDLPKNYYEARQLVAKLGLGAKRIDCCVNGCMLYYSNEFGVDDGALLECKFCQEPRYRVTRNSRSVRRKSIPRKAMFYLPIIPRLQRLYASMQTASKMTWHRENYERRKMSDGFTPYTQVSATPYSCWPVLVTPYNLPPDMCMSKPYMFLAAVIPGPSSPTVGIDIYLQPLIDDLKRLWNGVATYDINQK